MSPDVRVDRLQRLFRLIQEELDVAGPRLSSPDRGWGDGRAAAGAGRGCGCRGHRFARSAADFRCPRVPAGEFPSAFWRGDGSRPRRPRGDRPPQAKVLRLAQQAFDLFLTEQRFICHGNPFLPEDQGAVGQKLLFDKGKVADHDGLQEGFAERVIGPVQDFPLHQSQPGVGQIGDFGAIAQ